MKQIQEDQELQEIETKKNQIQQYSLSTPKHEPKEIEYQKLNILDGPKFSPYLQKCEHYVPARLTTLNKPGPYSKCLNDAFQTSFSKEKKKKRVHWP